MTVQELIDVLSTLPPKLKRGSPWYHIPDEWRLVGPWPEEAAEIGIEMENE